MPCVCMVPVGSASGHDWNANASHAPRVRRMQFVLQYSNWLCMAVHHAAVLLLRLLEIRVQHAFVQSHLISRLALKDSD